LREAKEESGLEVEMLANAWRPPPNPAPAHDRAAFFSDIHRIAETHEHIGHDILGASQNGAVTLRKPASRHPLVVRRRT